MKVTVELEFKEMPVEKIQQTLLEILHTLKAIGMTENGKFEIHTPDGVITENCILQQNKVVA